MRRALALLTVLGTTLPAQAQEVSLAPSPAVRCLTPAEKDRGEPEYPFDPWKRGEGGSVVVDLTFTTPDRRPQVDIVSSQGAEDFVSAVKAHVDKFRVPCLEHADIPVKLRQEYVFTPDLRAVAWTTPVDMGDAARQDRIDCIVRTGEQTPRYPLGALERELRGRMLLYARFSRPDAPPEVRTYTVGRASFFEGSAQRWAKTLRMPCVGDSPVSVVYQLVYKIRDDPSWGFKPLDLQTFVRAMRGVREQRAQFDTAQMGCPFDLRLQYRQPHLPNFVGQVGTPDPRRQPLMDWLSRAELDLRRDELESVYADIAHISVPCTRINLNPKENS